MRKLRFSFVCLLLVLWPSLVGAEIYQWADQRGVIHFTDNFLSVPEAVRKSDLLIVRDDLPAKRTFADDRAPDQPPQEPSMPHDSHGQALSEPDFVASSPPPVVYYSPQELQIVVIDSLPSAPHGKHCPASRGCEPAFRPNFNDRRFIHPSVFNGPRHITHPRASKPARK